RPARRPGQWSRVSQTPGLRVCQIPGQGALLRMPTRTRVRGDDSAWDVREIDRKDDHGATPARENLTHREAPPPAVPHQLPRPVETGRLYPQCACAWA